MLFCLAASVTTRSSRWIYYRKTKKSHQLVRHGQEPRPGAALLDLCDELPLRCDVAVLVEQVLPRHPHLVEGQLGVVDPVQAHLVAHVLHRHPGHGLKHKFNFQHFKLGMGLSLDSSSKARIFGPQIPTICI